MHKLLAISAMAIILLAGCTEENLEPLPDGTRYFPIDFNRALVYRSDSIIFDDDAGGNVMDTLSGFIREVVVDTMTSGEGILTYIAERRFKRKESEPWGSPLLYLLHTEEQFAYRTEGNLRFVKMRFPLRMTTNWDPTAYFNEMIEVPVGTETVEMYTNWSGRVTELDQPESVSDMVFDSVMTCVQADDDNEIERRFVMEQYATGVGLIFRADTILDSRCKRLGDLEPCFDQTWSEKGEKGYILRQELIAIE